MVETEFGITVYLPTDVDARVQAVSLGGTMCGIRGVARFNFKVWKNYYLAWESQEELATIFNRNCSFNDGCCVEAPIKVSRTPTGDARIVIMASDTPLSLTEIHAGEGNHVGRIDCKSSRLPTNLTPIPLVVECQTTVRFENDHLPPERVLSVAVYHGEGLGKRLVGHTRVLMKGTL
ncbi:uncharacterized protein BO95DRAFT_514686 [Aspergillus brunneoviolaceus CBS 621.78]|uniref:Uncharacterized protein n=1 Tax=Aspergillus brunneoviolaceus CBS 621.78 TaxID=1450534 RepID=A0ACD1G894_9EURO|nr:hypothetical protein BO95DRAFT_514686 [Aspergillus brunneoviolaceus CBS 621.78]RAH45448.1 hypothetical protein BO95DRAFT_514686 [Aspergillus brunneoviolaceus CBS 621.78]